MDRNKKHWLDENLIAPNVMEVDVELPLIERPIATAAELQGRDLSGGTVSFENGMKFDTIHPEKWGSDICWVTPADVGTYRAHEEIFAALGLAQHISQYVEFRENIILYNTLFVVRSRCSKPHFHCDWYVDNNAFTFLTPLTQNCADLGLTYASAMGGKSDYEYRMGKGIVFGDHFSHATAAGETAEPVVLLAFQFGTDDMENYPNILKSAYQGAFHRRPDGAFVRDGQPVA